MGHQGHKVLAMANTQFNLGLTEALIKKLLRCDVCTKAKATRQPIRSAHVDKYDPTRSMEIFSADLFGPVSISQLGIRISCPSVQGSLYVLVLVEEHSRAVFIELLQFKSQAGAAIIRILTMLMNQIQRTILKFRSDGGGEFNSKHLLKWFEDNGIKVTTSTRDHPAHNGIAERMNRTLLELTRVFLIQSNAPMEFWGYALNWAAFVYNNTPHPSSNGKPPLETLLNLKMNLNKFKVWGCNALVLKPASLLSKVQAQTFDGIFIDMMLLPPLI